MKHIYMSIISFGREEFILKVWKINAHSEKVHHYQPSPICLRLRELAGENWTGA
jgi:hypothetical protein